MAAETSLSATDRLLYLGRVAWSQARLPVELRRLSIAAEHLRERAFPRGAELAREGEPMASCHLLVQGRVQVSRRGTLLGEADPGSLVGLEPLLSQDHLGLGVVAATDVLALQLDSDTLLDFLGDQFPLVHNAIRASSRRLLALTRRLPGSCEPSTGLPVPEPHDESTGLLIHQPEGRRMNLVEALLFLRSPGGPYERSRIDALAELAATVTQAPFRAGHVFWREGEPATRMCLVAEGIVACGSSRDALLPSFRVGPGRALGVLESMAGEPRWYDAVAETAGILLEQDVEGLIDLFEDNVDVALDYLAWVSGTTLDLIERELGPGRELLEFFTNLAAFPAPKPHAVDDGRARPAEGVADPYAGSEHEQGR